MINTLTRKKLKAPQRRAIIVEAARKVIARKGYAGARTREIAEEAGVSEALLYRHFPSKESLYQEVQKSSEALFEDRDDAFEYFRDAAPSTKKLAEILYFISQAVVSPHDQKQNEMTARLVANSCLTDGKLVHQIHMEKFEALFPMVEACLEAAKKKGERRSSKTPDINFFWFAQHVPMASRIGYLPKTAAYNYQAKDLSVVVDQIVEFQLRGMGITDEGIEANYDPKALKRRFGRISW